MVSVAVTGASADVVVVVADASVGAAVSVVVGPGAAEVAAAVDAPRDGIDVDSRGSSHPIIAAATTDTWINTLAVLHLERFIGCVRRCSICAPALVSAS